MAVKSTFILMFLTCLYICGIQGQQTKPETDLGVLVREELDKKLAHIMRETRQETDELRAAIRRLEEENTALKEDNIAMKEDISALKQNNDALKQNQVLEKDIGALRHDSIALRQQVNSQNYVLGTLGNETAVIKQHIQHLLSDPRHDEEAIQIAFSVASHESFGPVSDDTNIPFEIIYVNIGNGWNPSADLFQVLVAGVYQFYASIRSDDSANVIYCNIVHTPVSGGQTTVASLYGPFSGYGYGGDANSVILELEQGDVVSVKLQPSGVIHSSPSLVYSTFSGFLIFSS